MLIGYARVSKSDGSQSLDLQIDALQEAGVQAERIYHDFASGKQDDRPGLLHCLKALQPGNTLVVWKLDRLGRSLKDLITIVDQLRQQGIGFKILTGQGAQLDTTTPNGRLTFSLFAALAEYERELVRERTLAGLKAARARGRLGGRPPKMDVTTLRLAMAAMADRTSVASEVAKRLEITTATLYKYINGDGTAKPAGLTILQKP